jgi:lysophospholipase L1-like esterase
VSARRVSARFIAFAVTPTVVLLAAAETTVRLKYYFFSYGRDWRYLTTPIGRGSIGAAPIAPSREETREKPEDQIVFRWQTPCVDSVVHSADLQKDMPRTWDEHCFRGDRVGTRKPPGEYRIVVLGGSTVEDAQSDEEMWTAQLKRALLRADPERRITVVNAGRANFDSRVIRSYWQSIVRTLSPDLVVYYEAWNEQQGDIKFTGMRVDQGLAAFAANPLHRALYYRSMLYTYLVERFGMRMAATRFWKVDVAQLRNFVALARSVRESGARFVFATQIVRFPRIWKEVDTFDYHAVDALLDRLRADRTYRYDVNEISALNQRLVVAYTLQECRRLDVPVVNILDAVEALGDSGRAELFTDLGHLTVKGDRLVGTLIAQQLLSPVGRRTPAVRAAADR